MKNEKIELKSLGILNAVLETKSVTAAAELLSLSPSSVTYAINKLRDVTANPIFTRSKGGVVPTTLALDLNARYLKAMSLINGGLEIAHISESDMGFSKEISISTYTFLEFWLSMTSLNSGMLERDGVALKFAAHPLSSEERINKLRSREVDIDIGSELPRDKSITSYKLLTTNTQAMVSNRHPTIKNKLTIEDWHNYKHLVWFRDDYGKTTLLGDAVTLNELRERRTVLVTSTSSLNMMMLCAQTDNIMLTPRSFTPFLQSVLPVNIFDLPFDVDISVDVYLHFHNQSLSDQYICNLLKEINKLVGK